MLFRHLYLILIALLVNQQLVIAQIPEVGIWDTFALSLQNDEVYADPFRDVTLSIQLISPGDDTLDFWGFYDGENTWRVRFMPDEYGKWSYKVYFSDDTTVVSGAFRCVPSAIPGQIHKDMSNPYYLGYKGGKHQVFRSMHVGDRFFAENWSPSADQSDNSPRHTFLDWIQEQGYNMLSIASHYLNRDEEGRGKGWDTPDLWPLDPVEYQKMERILDELKQREIIVFPFGGFMGARADWPTNPSDQEHYIKYTLARLGHYWNIILSVAGPEPLWRKKHDQYQGEMKLQDINRLGNWISTWDIHDHLLTIHNEKRATQYGDPFLYEEWYDMSTLQGPTTLDREQLFSGLLSNHHMDKPQYAQETLWSGNKWHPQYTDDQLRKNAYTILFAGATLNFADMNGNSSTGFSGELDFEQLHAHRHDIVKRVWDFWESIPFYQMIPRQDLVKNGYCLANEGQEYYVYRDTIGEIEVFLDYPYPFEVEWINAQDPSDIRSGGITRDGMGLTSPQDGDDWIAHIYAPQPDMIAEGHFPDIAIDQSGNIHIVYHRDGLKYKMYERKNQRWSDEMDTGCECVNIKRSEPDIVVDSRGNAHVFCGSEYARRVNGAWISIPPGGKLRDTELAINDQDQVFLIYRQGPYEPDMPKKGEGFVGLKKIGIQDSSWQVLTSPDVDDWGHNNHVYPDMTVVGDTIHVIQRHGPRVEVTYRYSIDGGESWQTEDASSDRKEGPHITVGSQGDVYITTGNGTFLKRVKPHKWVSEGTILPSNNRYQPELTIDSTGNIYTACFGGIYNIRQHDSWMGIRDIAPRLDAVKVGFVALAGYSDHSYIIWEEGKGNPDEGLSKDSQIYIGRLYPDGRIIGLTYPTH